MVEAYCVKCKAKREMKDPKESKTARGTTMMKGKCPTCGTTMCRMMGKK
jgi:NAD-dependent SIR2 family protein deacetylase